MRWIMVVFLAPLTGLAVGEELGPFDSTPAAGVAPEARRVGMVLQREPAAAFGKSIYLVVWSDGSRMAGQETADIYCARVAAGAGRSLDPKGIVVCRAKGLQERPAVAFDGTNFLVVWQDLRNETDYDLYAARVTEEGKVLDPDGLPLVKRANNQALPAVAFADGKYVVTWMDARQYPVYGIYFSRVSADGRALDGEGLPLDVEDPAKIAKVKPQGETWLADKDYWWNTLASRTAPAIATDGKSCLVVYMREYPFAGSGRPGLTAALIQPDGAVTKPVQVAGGPSPAWTGRDWALGGPAWKGGWTPTPLLGAGFLPPTPVETKEAAATLDVVSAFGGGYNVGKGSTANFPSSAAFNGANALVAMQYAWRPAAKDRRPTYAILLLRVSTAGEFKVLDAKPLAVETVTSPESVNRPVLAAGPNGECLLVYEKDAAVETCAIIGRIMREKGGT